VVANNDGSKKTSYTQALESYKGQSLPTTGVPVKVREVFLDSMVHYDFDTDPASTYKVAEFLTHLETKGFLGLKGRNKKSNNPETNDLDFHQKATFAITHKLHHYHIGIPEYKKSSQGDLTSEYIIHYSFDETLGYVDVICIDYHPPLQLPYESDLQSPFLEENPFKIKSDK
jgi:hypothetical protein